MQKTSREIITGSRWTKFSIRIRVLFLDVCQKIDVQLETLLLAVDLGFETSAQVHQANAELQSVVWRHVRTKNTCLFCLRTRNVWRLRHGLWVQDDRQGFHFEFGKCILCAGKRVVEAKLKSSLYRAPSICHIERCQ